jgi:hypothetical protein
MDMKILGDFFMKTDITVTCYTFPGFHPSALNRKIFGTDWSEYVLMRQDRPWFSGHDQPKRPALGELDESKPQTWELYIDLATRHGIDVFIHDWYWYHQGPAMHEALEEGFLKASNCTNMKFAVMWTDHDWPRWVETYSPDGTFTRPITTQNPVHHVKEIYQSMAYCLSRYLHLPNYWRIDDKPVLVIFAPFIIGDVTRSRKILDDIRDLARKMGHKDLHLHASHGGLEMKELMDLGFDSYAHYNPLGDVGNHRPVTEEVIDYPTLINDIVKIHWPKWNALRDLPFFPTVAPGFDWTPRMLPRTCSGGPPDRNKWPGCIILKNDTPKAFGDFVRAGVDFINANKVQPRILMMGCWNEWTEGHYLLPDLTYGYGKLEALAQALGLDR